jgi:hypothetical protein
MMFVGPSAGGQLCAVCSAPIARGEIEFEAPLHGQLTLLLDRPCAEWWAHEANGRP